MATTLQNQGPKSPKSRPKGRQSTGRQRRSDTTMRSHRVVERRTPIDSASGGTRIEREYFGPNNSYRRSVEDRTPLNGQMGATQRDTQYFEISPEGKARRSGPNLRSLNPANAGEKAAGGVGMLEAEFIIAIGLLVLLMFANSNSTYAERIMSLMKRGTLTCVLFFVLALVSSAGANAEKVAKAFGALIIVAILITTPANTVITDVDSLIKNDWVGTDETGNDTAASADKGTIAGSGTAENAAIAAAEAAGLPGELAALLPTNILAGIGSAASKGASAVKSFLSGFGL